MISCGPYPGEDSSPSARSGGIEAHAAKLREEGHEIVADKGKKPPKVAEFDKSVIY